MSLKISLVTSLLEILFLEDSLGYVGVITIPMYRTIYLIGISVDSWKKLWPWGIPSSFPDNIHQALPWQHVPPLQQNQHNGGGPVLHQSELCQKHVWYNHGGSEEEAERSGGQHKEKTLLWIKQACSFQDLMQMLSEPQLNDNLRTIQPMMGLS